MSWDISQVSHQLFTKTPKKVKSSQDCIGIHIKWDDLGYVKMLGLAHDDEQRWFYYPDRPGAAEAPSLGSKLHGESTPGEARNHQELTASYKVVPHWGKFR